MDEPDLLFWKTLPDRLQQDERAKDIRLHKDTGVFDRSIDMGFGRKVDDGIHALPDDRFHLGRLCNIRPDKTVPRGRSEIGEVLQISGIG
jgi:hypothetical protein